MVEETLRTLVLPAFAVAAGLFVVVCAATPSRVVRTVAAVLALLGGLAAGNEYGGMLHWWPVESDDAVARWPLAQGWAGLLPLTAVAVLAGAVAALFPERRRWWAPGLRMLVATACAWWLAQAWEPVSRVAAASLLFAAMTLNGEALLHISRRCQDASPMPLLAGICGMAAATLLIFAHSARFFEIAVLMTVVTGGMALAAWFSKADMAVPAAALAVFFPGLLLGGAANTHSQVPEAAFALAALAPCMLWLLAIPPVGRRTGRGIAIAATVLVLIPCVTAVVLAAQKERLEFGSDY